MRLSDCLCGPDVANGGGPMSETLQLILVGVAVAGAAGYVVRATWKTWFGKSKPGCGSGCGKCAAPAPDADGRHPLPMA